MRRVIASWFGTGLILGRIRGGDLGSGTLASLITLPVGLWVGSTWGWQTQTVVAALVLLIGAGVVSGLAADEGDAGWIVIDEAGGTLVAVVGLTVWPAVVAWLVFRAADIFKRYFPGVARAERLPGASGVMMDDIVAGLYGLIAGHIVQALV